MSGKKLDINKYSAVEWVPQRDGFVVRAIGSNRGHTRRVADVGLKPPPEAPRDPFNGGVYVKFYSVPKSSGWHPTMDDARLIVDAIAALEY